MYCRVICRRKTTVQRLRRRKLKCTALRYLVHSGIVLLGKLKRQPSDHTGIKFKNA